MKSRITFLSVAFFLILLTVNAQECSMYFPDNIGSKREMKFYDQRDRLTSVTRHEILDKTIGDNKVNLKVRATSFDKDDTEIHTAELELVCENGIFKFDLTGYLDPATLSSYEEMGIEIEADNLEYPSNMSAGDELPDGGLKMVVKSGSATLITVTLNIINRKVEGREDITTEAGTFASYKLSYDMTTKAGFITSNSNVVEWISEGVGLVRSETYNRRGRLAGYSVLTGYSN
jgi:hypothetical protein